MRTSKEVAFLVVLNQPDGVNTREMASYIQGEIRSGTGQLNPADPLFHLDRASVRVTPAQVRNKLVVQADMGDLAQAILKFAPDLAEELVKRFRAADGALEDFLKVLRKEDHHG